MFLTNLAVGLWAFALSGGFSPTLVSGILIFSIVVVGVVCGVVDYVWTTLDEVHDRTRVRPPQPAPPAVHRAPLTERRRAS